MTDFAAIRDVLKPYDANSMRRYPVSMKLSRAARDGVKAQDAFRKHFEVAVLIANDSDLAEPVRIVSQELHMSVGILNPHQHHSNTPVCETILKRIGQVSCQSDKKITHDPV